MPPLAIFPRSQACQDLFVFEVLVKPENLLNGTFLEIGTSHPIEINNTYELERLGWRGILVDNDPGSIALCGLHRRVSPAIQADATRIDWTHELRNHPTGIVDYLSLDIDAATLPALQNLLKAPVQFRVMTIESDLYRLGPGPRDAMRQLLVKERGYELVCADVRATTGEIFEEWYVSPTLVPLKQYERFRSTGLKCTEIIARA